MSKLFSEVEYIPLETNDSCLIGSMSLRIKISDKYIYTIEDEKVMRYFSDGSFDRIIIKHGRGPDQLFAPRDIGLSENYIYVLGYFDIAKLDTNGNLIKRVKMPEMSESIYCYPDGRILVYHGITIDSENSFKAAIYDENLNLVKSFWPNPLSKYNGGTGIRLHPDGKRIFLTHLFADTVFNMTKVSPEPFMSVDFGGFTKFIGKLQKFPHLQDLAICDHLWIFSYLHYFSPNNPLQYKLIYLENKDIFYITSGEIINDIDSGLGFSPFLTHNLNDQRVLYSTLEPLNILNRASVLKREGQSTKSKKFLEMAEKINLNSNLILMKCRIKD
jgi:hypothetical protein